MKVKFWGVRSSYPVVPYPETIEKKIVKALTLARPGDISSEESVKDFIKNLPLSIKGTYGGNTTCFEVRTSSGELIIIDCGSGLVNLGKALMNEEFGKGRGTASVLLTRTHWDHIQGIPFFTPLCVKGNTFNFYSPIENLEERINSQQNDDFFPISFDDMHASKKFFKVKNDDSFYLNDVKIFIKNIPSHRDVYAVRIEDKGRVFVYTSYCEFNIDEVDLIHSFESLFKNADVLVFDTHHTSQIPSTEKITWGYSSASIAIEVARMYNVKNLVFFHHNPNSDDEYLDNVLLNARTYLNMNRKGERDVVIDVAREGMVFNI